MGYMEKNIQFLPYAKNWKFTLNSFLQRQLQDGDIINVDVTVYLDGYHGDTSETFLIGQVDEGGQRLVEAAGRCRERPIAACKPGAPLCVIGNTISEVAHASGFQVFPTFIGHGIGSYFHCHPEIWHHGKSASVVSRDFYRSPWPCAH
ncbi:methionine aminopeptidase 1D, mitochondrial-like, partial [Etheostoma spectabile]|uniref:methionine aminopeptidase 1D, mitochondrial-like n=1 Tax=Etheostoma spectabile TaxID=54343 RepID=UPI0013AF6BB2